MLERDCDVLQAGIRDVLLKSREPRRPRLQPLIESPNNAIVRVDCVHAGVRPLRLRHRAEYDRGSAAVAPGFHAPNRLPASSLPRPLLARATGAAIQHWWPWERATAPRTPEGKARVVRGPGSWRPAATKAAKLERAILAETGHRSVMMVRRYIREAVRSPTIPPQGCSNGGDDHTTSHREPHLHEAPHTGAHPEAARRWRGGGSGQNAADPPAYPVKMPPTSVGGEKPTGVE